MFSHTSNTHFLILGICFFLFGGITYVLYVGSAAFGHLTKTFGRHTRSPRQTHLATSRICVFSHLLGNPFPENMYSFDVVRCACFVYASVIFHVFSTCVCVALLCLVHVVFCLCVCNLVLFRTRLFFRLTPRQQTPWFSIHVLRASLHKQANRARVLHFCQPQLPNRARVVQIRLAKRAES